MEDTVNGTSMFDASDFAPEQTENLDSPAVEDAKEQPTSQNGATEPTDGSTNNANEPQTGDDVADFLAKKGIKMDDPDALRKVASMYQNVEKDYGKKSQEKAQLEREIARMNANVAPQKVNANDPMARVERLEQQLAADRQLSAVREWKAAKNPSPEVEAKMIEYLERPLVSNGVPQTDNQGRPLTNNFLVSMGAITYDDVYRLVGGESLKADAIKAEIKTAVTNEIAAKQNAKSPAALATNSTQFGKPNTADDDFLAGLLG